MPNILYNKQTGAPEQLTDQKAVQAALAAGTHEVALVQPDGSIGSVDVEYVPQLLAEGYQQPTDAQLAPELKHAKYNTTTKIAQSAALGAAEGALGPVGTALAKVVTTDEDINNLREESPIAHGVGQAAGLIGSTMAGVGVGGMLTKAGAAVEGAIGATSAMTRIGSMAARAAAENAIFQAGDELGRGLTNDPHTDIESAMAHIGLSAVLGGGAGAAFGAVPELWRMGEGNKKLEQLATAFRNKSEGAASAVSDVGLELAPEIDSVFANSEKGKAIANELMDSGSKSGDKMRASVEKTKQMINEATPELVGRTTAEVDALHTGSKYEVGTEVRDNLKKVISEEVAPLKSKFDEFEGKFAKQGLETADHAIVSEALAGAADVLGTAKMPSGAGAKLISTTLQEMALQETVADLRKYGVNLGKQFGGATEGAYAAGQIRKAIDGAIENIIERKVQIGAPQMLEDYRLVRQQYGSFKGLLEELNQSLHLGKNAEKGEMSFLDRLSDLTPEQVLERLNLKKNVNLQNLLAEKFPAVAEMAKKETLDSLLRKSLSKEGGIDTTKFLKQVKDLSPELRNYVLSGETQKRLGALGDLMNKLPTGVNSSKTATALDKMWKYMPSSAAGMLAWVTGHNPAIAAIVGQIAHYAGREAPDAVKLAMLKYIGSGQPLSGAGLRAAVQSASATIKGEALLSKAAKGIYKGAMPVISQPSVADREKLIKRIEHLYANQDDALHIGGDIGHYLPDHGAALGLSSTRAVTYLLSLKPNTQPQALLDKPLKPTKAQEATFNRALDLAQAPLLIMSDIKHGRLTSQDVKHLNALYPNLAQNIAGKLQQEMIEAVHAGIEIPYKTKMSLSLVLNQPLESSLSPANIQAAQPVPPMPQQQGMSASKMSGLKKLPGLSGTSQQSRELHRMATSK